MGLAHDLGLMKLRRHLPSPTRAWRSRSFPLRAPTVPGGIEQLDIPSRTGANFETEWARTWGARMIRAAAIEGPMRAMVGVLASPTRNGTDRMVGLKGPVIFVANHHSHLDTPLLLTSIPEPWRHRVAVGAAADYFFGSRLAGATAALIMGAVPIERARVGRRSADMAAGLLDDGWSLLIYPEGGRSKDGWGQPFRGGAAYLALRCGTPVVPIHIRGTGAILRKGASVPKPAETTVTFGSPLRPAHRERAARFATRIEAAVTALADESVTDWYSARRRAHAGRSGTLVGPDSTQWRRKWALGSNSRKSKRSPRWPKP